jgi:hypothetical protein
LAADTRAISDLCHRLIRLQVPLSPSVFDALSLQLNLRLFGVIRHVRPLEHLRTLHIQFLQPLSQKFTIFFEYLEEKMEQSDTLRTA